MPENTGRPGDRLHAAYHVRAIEFGSWSPQRDGKGKSTEVHVVLTVEGLEAPLVLRCKSRQSVQDLIDGLKIHQQDVFPEFINVTAVRNMAERSLGSKLKRIVEREDVLSVELTAIGPNKPFSVLVEHVLDSSMSESFQGATLNEAVDNVATVFLRDPPEPSTPV